VAAGIVASRAPRRHGDE